MEIADYARLVARRSGPVMIVTAVAAMLAALLFLTRPERYVGATAVVVPTPVISSSLLATVSQSVSDFQAAVSSTVVANEVAASTDLSPSDITGGVESTRIADSSVVEVRFEADRPALAERVSLEVSREALVMLLSARVQPFEAQLSAAQQHYDDVQADYDAFLARTGYVVPDRVFLQETNEMQDLRNQIGAAISAGDTDLAEELQERLDAKADRIVPDSAEFYAISNAQRVATQNLATAQASYDSAKASLDSVRVDPEQGGVLTTSPATPVSRLQTFLEMVVPTAVIAMILAIGLVILLEVIATRRPGQRPAARGSDEGRPETPRVPAGGARAASVVAPATTVPRRRRRSTEGNGDDRPEIPTPARSAAAREAEATPGAQREATTKAARAAKAAAQREARAKARVGREAEARAQRPTKAGSERGAKAKADRGTRGRGQGKQGQRTNAETGKEDAIGATGRSEAIIGDGAEGKGTADTQRDPSVTGEALHDVEDGRTSGDVRRPVDRTPADGGDATHLQEAPTGSTPREAARSDAARSERATGPRATDSSKRRPSPRSAPATDETEPAAKAEPPAASVADATDGVSAASDRPGERREEARAGEGSSAERTHGSETAQREEPSTQQVDPTEPMVG